MHQKRKRSKRVREGAVEAVHEGRVHANPASHRSRINPRS
jgi:hypothetical protein